MSISSVLAIDQGTTGTTCLVVGQNGKILGRAYSEFTQYFRRPGWVEHDALEIWDTTTRVAREAIDQASGADICAIGIANQRETVVLWDRETLKPVHPAIVWQDRRTVDICQELRNAGYETEVRFRTGLVLDPYFSGTKIRWILDQNPDLRSRAESGELAAGTIDTWLLARLTDGTVHATDPTNASRTLLFHLTEASWDPWLLDIFGIPQNLLPEVCSSSGYFGVASGAHLGIQVPITGIAGDQQAALFGQGCWSSGLAKNTYGTGAFLLLNTGKDVVRSTRGLLTTAACNERGGLAYALEGSVFIAGAAIQWLRDMLGLLETAGDSEAMAASVEDNSGVYFVPAFVGLGAPHWVPDARGMLVGLTRGTRREHIVRAALEAMAYGTMDVLQTMEEEAALQTRELRVDGGAAINDWLIQFQANVLGVPLHRPEIVETTALGAAGLAGLATGVWSDAAHFLSVQETGTRCEPRMSERERSSLKDEWDRATRAVIQWAGDS